MHRITLVTPNMVSEDKSIQARYFNDVIEIESLRDLAELLTDPKHADVCHGILFCTCKENEYTDTHGHVRKGRERLGSNLEQVSFLFYDFDFGSPSAAVKDRLDALGCSYLILASKNHLVSKDGKPPIEKFHVMIPLSQPLTSSEHYKYLWNHVLKQCGFVAHSAAMRTPRPDPTTNLVVDGQPSFAVGFKLRNREVLHLKETHPYTVSPELIASAIAEDERREKIQIFAELRRKQLRSINVSSTPLQTLRRSTKAAAILDDYVKDRARKTASIVGIGKRMGLTCDELIDIVLDHVHIDDRYDQKKVRKEVTDMYRKF